LSFPKANSESVTAVSFPDVKVIPRLPSRSLLLSIHLTVPTQMENLSLNSILLHSKNEEAQS